MTAIRTAHPAATPAARALALLAAYRPVDAQDAHLLLAALHQYGHDSVIGQLLETLDKLAVNALTVPGVNPDAAARLVEFLSAASETISGAAHDWLDRARENLPEPQPEDADTEGVPSWELDPAPERDPNPRPADGWAMHSVAASAVQEGDLLPGETWRRVVFVHDDRDGGVQITIQGPDGRMGSLEIVAAARLAVLRRRERPDWWCAHHGEDGMNTDAEPWCHGCVEAGVYSAPDTTDAPGRTATGKTSQAELAALRRAGADSQPGIAYLQGEHGPQRVHLYQAPDTPADDGDRPRPTLADFTRLATLIDTAYRAAHTCLSDPDTYPVNPHTCLSQTRDALAEISRALSTMVADSAAVASAAGRHLVPCPAPDIAEGYDSCRHGAWPCDQTKVAWRLRALDPDAEAARASAAPPERGQR